MLERGSRVSVTYEGTYEDGTAFDSTEKHGGEPLKFVIGGGQVLRGFEEAVLDMHVGQTREIVVEAADAFGEYDPALVQTEPIDEVPDGGELAAHVGQTLFLQQGDEMKPVRVVSARDGMLTVDFNHPMAGKRLFFTLTLVDVKEPIASPGEPLPPGVSAL